MIKQKSAIFTLAIAWPIAAYILGGFATVLLGMLLSAAGSDAIFSSDWGRLVATTCSVLVATTFLFMASRKLHRKKVLSINIGITRFSWKYLAYAAGLLAGLLFISYVVDSIYSLLHIVVDDSRNAQSFDAQSFWQLVVNVLIAGALTAWLEELLFRGFMFDGLKKALNPVLAAIIVSIIFAAVHFSIMEVPFLFLFSMTLCWLRQRSGSILPGMLVHCGFNAIVVSAAFLGIVI